MQIADLKENIESIVSRNEVVDEEILEMKTDFASLADRLLSIKVSITYVVDSLKNELQ